MAVKMERMCYVSGRLHAAIVGRTSRPVNLDDRSDEAFTCSNRRTDSTRRSNPGYLRLVGQTYDWLVKPVGPTGQVDCSRTGHIYPSNHH